jgi:branched-chain amino acid transport system ATP-binding protein
LALLATRHVGVSFGGLRALDQVDLAVEPACVTGLIGPNGAGKTTLFNVVCGLQGTDAGQVLLDGDDVTKLKAYERARRGLARTFQRLEVFGSLSARDNVLTAAEIHRSWSHDESDPDQVTDELVDRVGLRDVADDQADTLSTGMLRLVEVARALAARPRVLLLDEPSSGLDEHESDVFGKLLLDLAGEGLAVLMVEHDVPLVMEVCKTIHVLDFGKMIAVGTPDEIQANPDVQAAYLGATGDGDAG